MRFVDPIDPDGKQVQSVADLFFAESGQRLRQCVDEHLLAASVLALVASTCNAERADAGSQTQGVLARAFELLRYNR